MDRRRFTQSATASILAGLLHGEASADAKQARPSPTAKAAPVADKYEKAHMEAMMRHEHLWAGKPMKIAFLVYPGMFLLDVVGPLTMFESLMNREIHLVWKDKKPFKASPLGPKPLIPVTPSMTFAECPDDLDVICVPGGDEGTFAAMEDPTVLAFLRNKGAKARFITSVCSGSLILGAAGLLKGYKATSHWVARDALKPLGAIPTVGRIVEDRNRITAGGVTAGIDFGLAIVAKLRSDAYAQSVQLTLEYDPQPPFDAGSPEKAPKEVRAFIDDMFTSFREQAQVTAERAGGKI